MDNTHGGANRGQGRKQSALNKYLAVIRCTPEQWEQIKDISPEQRAEILLQWRKPTKPLARSVWARRNHERHNL
jgi:hypothetical protein